MGSMSTLDQKGIFEVSRNQNWDKDKNNPRKYLIILQINFETEKSR